MKEFKISYWNEIFFLNVLWQSVYGYQECSSNAKFASAGYFSYVHRIVIGTKTSILYAEAFHI